MESTFGLPKAILSTLLAFGLANQTWHYRPPLKHSQRICVSDKKDKLQ